MFFLRQFTKKCPGEFVLAYLHLLLSVLPFTEVHDAYPAQFCVALSFYSGKKLDDENRIGGRGRLTGTQINALQNFYGKAIRDNKGNAAAMWKATHANLKHYSSTLENPQHEHFPAGKDSWCSYNRDVATGETMHCPIQDPFPQAVVKAIQPMFDRIGDKHFIAGCEKCLDQNNNKCLHHVIWGMAPKEQFTSQQEANLAVALCVLVFNNGLETTLSKLMLMVNIQVQEGMIKGWRKMDEKGIFSSNNAKTYKE